MTPGGQSVRAQSLTDAKRRLVERLEEAGVGTERFISVSQNNKKPDESGTRTPKHPDDVTGNYAVATGDGLVVVDVDPHDNDPSALPPLPETFMVKTPHDGEHYYFTTDGDPKGRSTDYGDFQARGEYVVGPGSELTACKREWHDCGQPGEGHYRIGHDVPIACADAELVDALTPRRDGTDTASAAVSSDRPALPTVDVQAVDATLSTREWQRLGKAFEQDRTLKLLFDGCYRAAGFEKPDGGVDRSRAEYRLAAGLRWWLVFGLPGDVADRVAAAMNHSAQQTPETAGGEVRKWVDSTHGNLPLYRAETVAHAVYDSRTGMLRAGGYNPPPPPTDAAADGGENEVSYLAVCQVEEAVADLGGAGAAEITKHPVVSRERTQVNKALKRLTDSGTVAWERDGRSVTYRMASRPP